MTVGPRLLLVYLGPRLPKYVVENIRYLRRTFPANEIWLACDSARVERQAQRAGASIWRYEADESLKERLLRGIRLDPNFRRGFWLNSMLRLWAVEAFASTFQDVPVLHLEADVWLAPDAPLARWLDIECEIAYPLVNADAGAASVLLVKHSRALADLLGSIEVASEAGPATDMTLLGRGQHGQGVRILPTAPSAHACFHANLPDALRTDMSAGLTETGGIVDAATWGQYFFGLDAKNARGRRLLFADLPHHAIDCRRVGLRIGANGGVFLTGEFGAVPIYAFHVHSKDIRLFRHPHRLLTQRSRQVASGSRTEFDTRAFGSVIVEAFRRRLRKMVIAGGSAER